MLSGQAKQMAAGSSYATIRRYAQRENVPRSRQIDNETANMRRQMTQKYKTEF